MTIFSSLFFACNFCSHLSLALFFTIPFHANAMSQFAIVTNFALAIRYSYCKMLDALHVVRFCCFLLFHCFLISCCSASVFLPNETIIDRPLCMPIFKIMIIEMNVWIMYRIT